MSDEELGGLIVSLVVIVAMGILMVFIIGIAFTVLWHWAIAFAILALARSRGVRQWVIRHGWERHALRVWLWYLPALVTVIWAKLGYSALTTKIGLHGELPVVITACACGLLLHFYYQLYIAKMPHDSDWIHFIGATQEMKLERRLAQIERSTQMKLWWVKLWG